MELHHSPTLSDITQLILEVIFLRTLNECLQLRVKDIDFEYRQLVIRDPKGARDRFTILPATAIEPLKEHLAWVKRQHQQDLARWYGAVHLPFAFKDVKTTMIYTHVLNRGGLAVRSPLDL